MCTHLSPFLSLAVSDELQIFVGLFCIVDENELDKGKGWKVGEHEKKIS